jgi:ribosome-binding protein aMBF1 (putative translation factor)
MTHIEIRMARKFLGLSVKQMAAFLKTDPQTVRRLEMGPECSTARKPSPRIEEILQGVLDRKK